jgi:hypothetical protein
VGGAAAAAGGGAGEAAVRDGERPEAARVVGVAHDLRGHVHLLRLSKLLVRLLQQHTALVSGQLRRWRRA